MGVDPVGVDPSNLHSHNRYAYANNNPYKFVDPTGNIVETALDVISLGLSIQQYRQEPGILNGIGVAYDAIATIVPIMPAGFGIIRNIANGAEAGVDVAKAVSANSKLSEKSQVLYEIYKKTDDGESVIKTGVSSGKLTANGLEAVRARSQLSKIKQTHGDEVFTRIKDTVEAGPGARAKVLGLEKANADRLRGQLDRDFHKRP